jgi:hypothetical protein
LIGRQGGRRPLRVALRPGRRPFFRSGGPSSGASKLLGGAARVPPRWRVQRLSRLMCPDIPHGAGRDCLECRCCGVAFERVLAAQPWFRSARPSPDWPGVPRPRLLSRRRPPSPRQAGSRRAGAGAKPSRWAEPLGRAAGPSRWAEPLGRAAGPSHWVSTGTAPPNHLVVSRATSSGRASAGSVRQASGGPSRHASAGRQAGPGRAVMSGVVGGRQVGAMRCGAAPPPGGRRRRTGSAVRWAIAAADRSGVWFLGFVA